MAVHQFKVGSMVMLQADGPAIPERRSYLVEAQMPPVGAFLQYRIKSEGEGFRRVVLEHQLTSLETTKDTQPLRTGNILPGEAD